MSSTQRTPRRRALRPAALALAPLLSLALLSGGTARAADLNSINHMVVLMQENRSFDHYLGQLKTFDPTLDVEAEPANASNPDPTNLSGSAIAAFHQTEYCEVADLDHSWNGTHEEWNSGAMDGFTKRNVDPKDPNGSRAMGYYTQADLPYYYSLYDTFAMGDRFFASTLTQTFPNRFYLLAGTSFGQTGNDFPVPPKYNPLVDFAHESIFNRLDAHNPPISWRVYYNQIAFALEFSYVRNNAAGHVFPISQYYADAAAGLLPQVSFVDPVFLGTVNVENDEHPPTNIQVGQKFTHDVIGALMSSPNWHDSALFLTYDEHGGYYDHVPPPWAPAPDGIAPNVNWNGAGYDNLGIRVPAVVVSPWSKYHYVTHVVHDHTSILKTIENRFSLGTLTARDAWAADMSDFFDFNTQTFATPPALADAVIDPVQLAKCEQRDRLPTDL